MSVLFKLKDHFKENQLFLNRTVAATVFVFLLLFILIFRLVYLQVVQHDTYAHLARNNQVRMLSVPPTRGLIYDSRGVLLAENIPVYSLEIIPSRVKNLGQLIDRLSKVVPLNSNDVKAFRKRMKYKGRFESIPIRTKLTEGEAAAFSLEKYQFPEVELGAHLTRSYPLGEVMSHILGYIGPISETDLKHMDIAKYRGTHVIGKSGIERFYEDTLHGSAGFVQVETDARGRNIRELERTAPTPGQNLYLSIDSQLQQIAFNALGDNQGAVVAIDVKTGGLLTLVSKPSFDPNLFIQGIDHTTYQSLRRSPTQPLFNRAIRGQYPPGSTVKPLVALQALEQSVIAPNTKIYDPGYYRLHEGGRLFRDWQRSGRGYIKLENALAQSSTTYFFYLSDKLGIEKIHQIYSSFGLGAATGIDIFGEAQGLAPSPQWKLRSKKQSWYQGETLNTGIGQGATLVTPLQMAQVTATIANRGRRIRPSLVQSLQPPTGKPHLKTLNLQTPVNLSNPNHWEIVIRGMQQAIKHPKGTAHRIYRRRNPYSVAGKTGTAQVFSLKSDEDYDASKIEKKLRDHGWFVAFAPIDNPSIAIAVLIENGKGSTELAKIVLDAYFKGTING